MSKKDLQILKVKNKKFDINGNFKDIHKHLLKPPFIGVFNGSVKTGKTTVFMNWIYNKQFYAGRFDKIIYISPTSLNDETLKHLSEDEDIIKINDNLDDLDNILKAIVEDKDDDEETKKEQWLIVLDDMLGYIKARSYCSYLCSRYRHYNISLIFATQNFRSIPNIIRANATFYLIWKTNNKKEYNKYLEEFEGIFEHFEDYYKVATEKPYNFLYLDLRNMEAYHNFENRLKI
jgi:hypothetical protein